eukprot:8398-Heterococcus_DN1.PRE.10
MSGETLDEGTYECAVHASIAQCTFDAACTSWTTATSTKYEMRERAGKRSECNHLSDVVLLICYTSMRRCTEPYSVLACLQTPECVSLMPDSTKLSTTGAIVVHTATAYVFAGTDAPAPNAVKLELSVQSYKAAAMYYLRYSSESSYTRL